MRQATVIFATILAYSLIVGVGGFIFLATAFTYIGAIQWP
jgi:hypothetical protein